MRGRARATAEQNGAAIRALRQKDGYTAEAFAARVGVSYSHYRNIENEHRAASVEVLNRIARLLVVPLAAILRDLDTTDTEAPENRGRSSPFRSATPEPNQAAS